MYCASRILFRTVMLIFMPFFRDSFRSQVLFMHEIYQDLKIEQEETNDSNRERRLLLGIN
jgi:hypothetical protein